MCQRVVGDGDGNDITRSCSHRTAHVCVKEAAVRLRADLIGDGTQKCTIGLPVPVASVSRCTLDRLQRRIIRHSDLLGIIGIRHIKVVTRVLRLQKRQESAAP